MRNIINYSILSIIFLFLWSCVERFDFNVKKESPGIVIEASISNRSFADVRNYPADGRYFQVRLGRTSDVTNVSDVALQHAVVALYDSDGNTRVYTEASDNSGIYLLRDKNFATTPNVEYQLRITLETGELFQSSWEKMPVPSTTIGALTAEETELEKYVYYKEGERRLETYDGVELQINLPPNDAKEKIFYRWEYDPLWVYVSPNLTVPEPIKTCYVTNQFYLNGYEITEDIIGDRLQPLFFIRTQGNDRMYEYFSALVTQSVLSEGYYNFWKDLKAQANKGGLFDQPPFGLKTNFETTNSNWSVNGYFGVVTEDAKRWVFNPDELSYGLDNNLYELCQISYGPGRPGGPECYDCRDYPFGQAVTTPPIWW